MKKVVENDYVAILYSPGFGAGWSTWNDDKKEWLLYHPEIVAAVQSGERKKAGKIAERIGKELYGENDYICILGAKDLRIAWISKGTEYKITEYDGNETYHTLAQMGHKIA